MGGEYYQLHGIFNRFRDFKDLSFGIVMNGKWDKSGNSLGISRFFKSWPC